MQEAPTHNVGQNMGLVFVLVSGVLMTAGGVLHLLLGWPALSEALDRDGLNPALKTTVGIGWSLGGSSMLSMGFMTLLLYGQLRSGHQGARAQGLLCGLLFLLFGAGASIVRFPSTHFLSFMGVGALLLLGLWMSRPRS